MGKSLVMQEFLASIGQEQNIELESEVNHLITESGLNPESMTLEDLRELVASYARKVLLNIKQSAAS